MKICSKCKIQKEVECFNKRGNGVQGVCKVCQESRPSRIAYRKSERYKQNQRDYNKIRRRKSNAWYLEKGYGVTIEQYNDLFQKQNGECAICHKPQSEMKLQLSVDHCHTTGKTRGLLCQRCN